jgi:hypothetical protein
MWTTRASSIGNGVAFFFQAFLEGAHAPGIFGVQLAAGFEGSPVRRDPRLSFRLGFGGGVRGDPRKDSGGERTADGSAVFAGEAPANFVDCQQAAFGHPAQILLGLGGGVLLPWRLMVDSAKAQAMLEY